MLWRAHILTVIASVAKQSCFVEFNDKDQIASLRSQ
jgi:hypothetical protein